MGATAMVKGDLSAMVDSDTPEPDKQRAGIRVQYGENRPILDGDYDESCAARCIDGTFVGKRGEGLITFKGIPFVGERPQAT